MGNGCGGMGNGGRFCALLRGAYARPRKLRGGKSLTRFTTSQFASGLDADASPYANRLV